MVLGYKMKKNIVIVVSAMNLGGAQRVVSILCNHWSKNGYKVNLISTYTGEKTNHYQVHDNVSLRYLSDCPYLSKNKLVNLLWKLFQLRKLVKSINPNQVISFLTRVNVASALSLLGLKIPLIICERTWTPFATLNKNFYWLYRILFKNIDQVIVQTDKSRAWLGKYFPGIEAKVIPNPTMYPIPFQNEKSLNPNNLISNDRKIILASGRLHKYKQFDLLMKAFSSLNLNYPDWDLVILGDGEERKALTDLRLDLDLENKVHLPGSVGNVSEWYERADLFVLSSSVEGFPNVLLEAMTYGLPCVSFDCDTGPRDMIQDGVNGILVAPDEKENGIIKALKRLIEDENYRNEISVNSILLREKFSVSNIMEKWDHILDL